MDWNALGHAFKAAVPVGLQMDEAAERKRQFDTQNARADKAEARAQAAETRHQSEFDRVQDIRRQRQQILQDGQRFLTTAGQHIAAVEQGKMTPLQAMTAMQKHYNDGMPDGMMYAVDPKSGMVTWTEGGARVLAQEPIDAAWQRVASPQALRHVQDTIYGQLVGIGDTEGAQLYAQGMKMGEDSRHRSAQERTEDRKLGLMEQHYATEADRWNEWAKIEREKLAAMRGSAGGGGAGSTQIVDLVNDKNEAAPFSYDRRTGKFSPLTVPPGYRFPNQKGGGGLQTVNVHTRDGAQVTYVATPAGMVPFEDYAAAMSLKRPTDVQGGPKPQAARPGPAPGETEFWVGSPEFRGLGTRMAEVISPEERARVARERARQNLTVE